MFRIDRGIPPPASSDSSSFNALSPRSGGGSGSSSDFGTEHSSITNRGRAGKRGRMQPRNIVDSTDAGESETQDDYSDVAVSRNTKRGREIKTSLTTMNKIGLENNEASAWFKIKNKMEKHAIDRKICILYSTMDLRGGSRVGCTSKLLAESEQLRAFTEAAKAALNQWRDLATLQQAPAQELVQRLSEKDQQIQRLQQELLQLRGGVAVATVSPAIAPTLATAVTVVASNNPSLINVAAQYSQSYDQNQS